MIWEASIICSVWSSFEALSFVVWNVWHPTLVMAAAVPVGFVLSTWAHFFLQLICPLGIHITLSILLVQCLIGIMFRTLKSTRKWWKMPRTFYVLTFLSMCLSVWACHCTFLRHGCASQGTAYSDLPFHMNLITSFAFGVNSNRTSFWPFQTPFYAFERLIYPIIPDFHASTLLAAGASLRMSMFMPSVLLCMSLTVSLYHLARRFANYCYIPEITVILFFFVGGSGWMSFFNQSIRWERSQGWNTNYAHNLGTHETFWIHSFMHFLLPQRSAMFSMPLCVCTMICLHQAAFGQFRRFQPLFLAGFFVSLMPMVSGHSFISISLYSAFLAAWHCPWLSPHEWKDFLAKWLFFAAPIVVIGIPQCLLFITRVRHSDKPFIYFDPIWKGYSGFFTMWWESLSIFVWISCVHSWCLVRRHQMSAHVPAFCVFVIGNLFRFQPVAMDNTKIFFAGWYPIACCSVALFFAKLFHQRNKVIKSTAILLFMGTIAAGTLCIIKSLSRPFPLFSEIQWQSGIWAIENTPVDAVFLTGSFPAVPATTIAGRLGFLTFHGWAWTHGLHLGPRLSAAKTMWMHHNTTMFRQNNVRYIYHSSNSRWNLTIDKYSPEWLAVFHSQDTTILELVTDLFHLS